MIGCSEGYHPQTIFSLDFRTNLRRRVGMHGVIAYGLRVLPLGVPSPVGS